MRALLICPADRPGLRPLTRDLPLVLLPLRGKTLLECWIEHLAARGATHVTVLAADRPDRVRAALDGGRRWGLQVELVAVTREFTPYEARERFGRSVSDWMPAPDDIVLLNYLPGNLLFLLDRSCAEWFAAAAAWIARPPPPWQLGRRELGPGVWAGLHVQVAPSARFIGPVWLGSEVVVRDGALVGPNAILEDRVVVDSGARIEHSHVGPDTFVGPGTLVSRSVAHGSLLVNWDGGSCLEVADRFLLCSLARRPRKAAVSGIVARSLALATLLVSAPFLLLAILRARIAGRRPALSTRTAARHTASGQVRRDTTFAYREFSGLHGFWRRWPQLWSIVRGDLAWFGNRPLAPAEARSLGSDFELLWLAVPPGLFSLSDALGVRDGLSAEACAHASYYSVHAGPRLHARILLRLFRRSIPDPSYPPQPLRQSQVSAS